MAPSVEVATGTTPKLTAPAATSRKISSIAAISELGTRSLGATLFSQHAFKRGPMYIQRLDCAQLPISVQHYTQQQPHVWARRSCFTKNALGILVAEVFLPQLWHDTQQLECNRL